MGFAPPVPIKLQLNVFEMCGMNKQFRSHLTENASRVEGAFRCSHIGAQSPTQPYCPANMGELCAKGPTLSAGSCRLVSSKYANIL